MAMSPKMRKICIWGGIATGVAGAILLAVLFGQRTSQRNRAQQGLTQQTARADSLQNVLNDVRENRDAWYEFAQARGDTIQALRDDTACADSIVVLNDSIGVLNDSIAGLNQKLNNCKKRRQAPRRNNGAKRPVTNPSRRDSNVKDNVKGNVTVISGADKQVTVPANTSGTVIVNNGDNNTVNVNNGTINNYYVPRDTSKVRITSKASVSTTYIVKVRRANCK